jgi:sulfur relay (sulfurtransferase) DsrC/TusE family protein
MEQCNASVRRRPLVAQIGVGYCSAVPGGHFERRFRVSTTVLVALVSLLALGCGGQSKTTSTGTTAADSQAARQDAVVAFYRAFIADVPARKASLEAALRLRSATAEGHFDQRATEQALSSYLKDAEAWQRSVEALPAANSDLEPIRRKFSEAAADEVHFVRDYAAFLRHAKATGVVDKASAQRVEALRGKLQSLNTAAGSELSGLVERLGGESAFHGHLERKHLEELLSSMRQQAAG